MAQAIYREWFVRFRYPGHEDVPLIDSPIGRIPEGWAVNKTRRPRVHTAWLHGIAQVEPVGPKYLRGMDINKTSYVDWSTVPYCPIDDKDKAKFQILPGDVFVIRMADPGKVGICEAEVDAVFASYLVRMRPVGPSISPYLLLYTLRDQQYQAWVTGASGGATRKSVSAKVMTEPLIVVPSEPVQTRFDSAAKQLRSLLNTLVEENARLETIRDLLLPRLVTGQIDVSSFDLDAEVESVA